MRFLQKFTPFAQWSRHKQRDQYIRLRGKIKKTKHEYGENFTSNLVLNEPDRPLFYNQWFDFYFLGLDGHTIWNAVLCTANEVYWDEIGELSSAHANSLQPYEEFSLTDLLVPVYDQHGRKKHYVMAEQKVYAEFGNQTRRAFMAQYESALIQKDTGDTAPVYECFRIDRKYAYGIGLYAVIDVPAINAEVIEAMIAKFRAIGEKEWQSDTPVPRDHLPRDTFSVIAHTIKSHKALPQ
jgi:hypothetical protein